MKTILRRKDRTSIFCPPPRRRHSAFKVNLKVIELTIACALITAGLFIMVMTS